MPYLRSTVIITAFAKKDMSCGAATSTVRHPIPRGAQEIFSFGPALVNQGEVQVFAGEEVERAQITNPRTAIGILEPLHYLMVVSDGRTRESRGLSLYQLAELMQSEGCETAYNLDGGGSTNLTAPCRIRTKKDGTVLIENERINRNNDLRDITDIIYFASAED